MDWWCPVDKKIAAQRIRTRLESRLASLLGCEPRELPRMKIGAMIHFAFLLEGTQETIGGFHTTMSVVLDLLGHEIVWDINGAETREEEVEETPSAEASRKRKKAEAIN
jgi:hypothetical protein